MCINKGQFHFISFRLHNAFSTVLPEWKAVHPVQQVKEMYPNYDSSRCFVTHSCADEELVQFAKDLVKENFAFDEVIETVAGSIITSHCGRNTLGVLFITK